MRTNVDKTWMTKRVLLVVISGLVLSTAIESHAADLIVTRDTTLESGKTYKRTIIKGSNITLNGGGAWLVGPGGCGLMKGVIFRITLIRAATERSQLQWSALMPTGGGDHDENE